ncbi:acyl-CoA dehydrogenase [Pandoraea fibrosis]|uniref:Acyl-CoA dehydrogenase n=3 Tax=Burkholderiaceae TaxID=119060 RepID=A0AAW7MHG6_9BURK|nr:acyl-CoA dehydrogenase family protein [Pandoraea cepalis]ALS65165.1 acyl-CoA dehydrogenase [Pandoraea apista]QHE94796.1 acyl-CoA dehydrogenase [Pandoraea fibrosis]MDN4572078.1 acyl-CoA dehydrogenase [Pandoraea cepalis]MDN4576734.1 acyl-CoA dehydrogenase [Pandoraea cepalis]QHF15930.1 acyl-CoA dehydrogenase [Pandoraea fibrosis]
MNFDIDPDDVAFRDEVRVFLREHLPVDMAVRTRRGYHFLREDQRDWTRILNRHGWSGANWPTAWGGTGWSPVRQFIFEEECFMAGAPPIDTAGFKMIGPVIMTFGSDALKQEFGPRILNGDVFWGQGFSEPNAGSDLASLSTRAVRDGDDYVINGRKIWTSYVETAETIFLLAKTDPEARQRGISMLLVDKNAPGVTIRPIIDIGESHTLNEVFFDDVRTPARYLVGEEGKGWTYGKYLLDLERAFSAEWPRNKRNLEQLRAMARLERTNGTRLIDAPGFASRLAQLEIDLQALEWLTLRALYEKDEGSTLPVGSLLKVRGSELLQKIGEMQVEALGDYGTYIYPDPDRTPGGEATWPPGPEYAPGVLPDFMYRRATTIYGGANEVQRTIIARSFLEL